MARISVVVPMFNVERYLFECLESIAAQAVDDLEVIMVDDGSTDSSAEIASDFAARDGRFRLIEQPNGGLGQARNHGVAAATGEFLAFVDSDDKLPRDAYPRLLRTLEETGSDFATGNVHRLSAEGSAPFYVLAQAMSKTRRRTHVTRFRPLLADRTAWNKLFRRSFWDAHSLRFPEGVAHEDIPVMIPAHFLARAVDVLAVPVYLYRVREDGERSITQRRFERSVILDRLTALERVCDFLTTTGRRRAREWYEESVLLDDLRYYVDQLEGADEASRQLFLDRADAFLARVSPRVFDRLPPLQRLKWHLARRRLFPELFEVLRFEREELDGARPVRVGWRWYADYPFRTDAALRIPPAVYAYRPAYVLHRLRDGDHGAALRAIGRSLRRAGGPLPGWPPGYGASS